MERTRMTLALVVEGNRILLGMKKRGFGEGRWNGFGGKTNEGESIESALARELREEVGIIPLSCKQCGLFDFVYSDKNKILEVHVYLISSFEGTPQESEEMRPQWFDHAAIPYDLMWPDDAHWLPRVLAGEQLRGTVNFSKDNVMLSHHFEKANSFLS